MASTLAGIGQGARSNSNKQFRHDERRTQRTALRLRRACLTTATLLSSIAVSKVHAQTLYWDINGTTANTGTAASQNWTSTSTFWNTSSTGTGGTIQAWAPGGSAVFSSGANFTGTSNVTLTGSQSVSSLLIEEGTLNLTSNSTLAGSVAMSGSSLTLTTAVAKTHSILVPITGAGGFAFYNTSGGLAVLNIDTQPQFQGNFDIGPGTSFANVTSVQLGYNLANPASLINMRNFSELGNNNPVTDPNTGLSTPVSYTVSNDIHLNVDNVANSQSFIGSSNGRTVTYSGVISGTSNVNFAYNAGGGRGTVVLSNVETYTGDTFINLVNTNGELRFGIQNSLPTATNVTVGGVSTTLSGTNSVGPIDLAGFNQQWASLNANGSGTIAGIFNTGPAVTLTIDGTRSTRFKGPIGKADNTVAPFGAGGGGNPNTNITLIKNNTSTLTLGASNAYTGDTTINGGKLVAGFSSTASTSPSITGNIYVNTGATLTSSGGSRNTNVFLSGALNINSGGTVDPGDTDTGTLAPHDVNVNGGSHIQFDIFSTTDYDLMNITGGLNLDNGTHTVDVGLATRSGAAINAGSYLVAQYGGRSWDGTDGFTLGNTPGGTFNYALDFQDNLLYLNVTPQGATYRWSLGGTFPVTEGSGTWQDGQGNFIDLANSNASATWSNSYTGDVIFGGDQNQPGGTITLGSNIVVAGTLRFSGAIASPYTIGDNSNANTLTLGGNVVSDSSPTINANVIVSGTGHTWTVNTGQTLSMNGSVSQANLETDSLTKAGSGVVAFFQPVTLNAINVTGGAVESWNAGVLANVPTISLDGNAALRAMAAQTIPANTTIGSGGGQLTVTGAAGTATMSGTITSTGNVTKQGGGTLVLTNNTNTIPSWTLAGFAVGFQSQVAFNDPGAIGTGPITFNGGGLQLQAPMTLTNNMVLQAQGHGSPTPQSGDGSRIDVGSNNATLAGVISGGGDLHKSGTGTLTISGTNTYQGGALFIDTASTIITTNASSLGAATVWPTTTTTLDVENDLSTACFRGNGAVIKVGPNTLNAGAVGGVPGGFNEGASLTATQGNVEMTNVSAFGGRMDTKATFATSTAAGNLPQATHAQYNITMNSGTELIDNFNGDRLGGSVTLNNATMTRVAGLPPGEGNFDSRCTWTLNTTPSVTVNYLDYGSSLSVTGSVTIRSLDTNATIASGGNILVFQMPVNVASGATLTLSDANTGGVDNNNFIAFRGVNNTNYNVVTDAFTIQGGATVITQGPGQVRFGRTSSEGKLIVANGTPGNEAVMKLSSNTFFSDFGSPYMSLFAVNGSGDAGLRIEAAMNATYTDRSVDTDGTHHDGTTGLLGINTTNTMQGGSPPVGFSQIGNAYTVMSVNRLGALSNSPGGTLTLAANDAIDATGLINNGPNLPTPLTLAVDNTASSANSNLVYQIAPNANGGKFANFAGLEIKQTSAGTGTVIAQVQPRSVTGGNSPLRLKSLSIAPTTALDLTDNDLVYSYGTNASPFSTVQNQVFNGYASSPDPSKRSSGAIISSTGQTAGNTILALFDNALVGVSDWPLGSGITIDANSVVGKYTYFGDMDLDGQVTSADYGVLDANLGTTPDPRIAWLSGDADLDGSVTSGDYGILDANLGQGAGNPLSPASAGAAGTSAVPEPTALTLIAAASGILLGRRRRRD